MVLLWQQCQCKLSPLSSTIFINLIFFFFFNFESITTFPIEVFKGGGVVFGLFFNY